MPYDGASHRLSPVYTFAINPSDPTELARGPTWDALRNYYRLYKELDWSNPLTPTIRARTHFPNTISLAASGYGGTAHYGHMYNRMDTSEDVFVSANQRPQPTKVGATPYVAREMLVWGLQNNSGTLRLTLSPITVLHNPYNVAMRLKRENTTDTAAMRLSYRAWSAWWMDFARNSAGTSTTWSWDMLTLAQSTDSSPNWAESFRTYIPEITLQPGEFRVFTLPAGAIPFNRLATTVNRYDFTGCFCVNTPGGIGPGGPGGICAYGYYNWPNCTRDVNCTLLKDCSGSLRASFFNINIFIIIYITKCRCIKLMTNRCSWSSN